MRCWVVVPVPGGGLFFSLQHIEKKGIKYLNVQYIIVEGYKPYSLSMTPCLETPENGQLGLKLWIYNGEYPKFRKTLTSSIMNS